MTSQTTVTLKVDGISIECAIQPLIKDDEKLLSNIANKIFRAVSSSGDVRLYTATIDALRQKKWRKFMTDALNDYVEEQQSECGRSERDIASEVVERALTDAPPYLYERSSKTIHINQFRARRKMMKRPQAKTLILMHLYLLRVSDAYRTVWQGKGIG